MRTALGKRPGGTKPGDILNQPGEPVDTLMFVLDAREREREGRRQISSPGRHGEILGELSLVDELLPSATVRSSPSRRTHLRICATVP